MHMWLQVWQPSSSSSMSLQGVQEPAPGRRLRRAVINISSNFGSCQENLDMMNAANSYLPIYCLDYRASKAAMNAGEHPADLPSRLSLLPGMLSLRMRPCMTDGDAPPVLDAGCTIM